MAESLSVDMTVIGVIVATVFSIYVYLFWREFGRNKTQSAFFEQAEERLGYPFPKNEVKNYEKFRNDIYLYYLKGRGRSPEDPPPPGEEEEEGGHPEDSWLRKLDPQAKKALQTALLRRCLICIPSFQKVHSDLWGKGRLYRAHLLSESHWKVVVQANDRMEQEVQAITYDAECLEEGWGNDIIGHAVHIYRMQKKKAVEEAAVKRQEKESEKEKIKAQKQIEREAKEKEIQAEKQKRAADKMAEQLLKEEEQKTKKCTKMK